MNKIDNRVQIIGITGKKGHGKDTLIEQGFYKLCDGHCKKLCFSDCIKDACSSLFGVDRSYFDDRSRKEKVIDTWNLSPRQMLQWLGTDVIRNTFNEDFFVKRMEENIKHILNCTPHCDSICIIIGDIRFDNEAKFVKKYIDRYCGFIMKVDGTKLLELQGVKLDNDKHESESGISEDLIDFTFYNDEVLSFDVTLDAMKDKLKKFLDSN